MGIGEGQMGSLASGLVASGSSNIPALMRQSCGQEKYVCLCVCVYAFDYFSTMATLGSVVVYL